MDVKEILSKVDGKKVVKYVGFAVAGIAAVAEAIGKDKDTEALKDLTKRVSDLEGKES